MPTELPPDYEHPDTKRRREAEMKREPTQVPKLRPREINIGRIMAGTGAAVVLCLGASLIYLIPEAKREMRILNERYIQRLRAEAIEARRIDEAKYHDPFLPKPIAEVTPITYREPIRWVPIQEVETKDPTNPLVSMTHEGLAHDQVKVDRSMRVAKCILESPKFKQPELLKIESSAGRQVVFDSGGSRYTAITWNNNGDFASPDTIAFWERPIGTREEEKLATYADVGLNGGVESGSMGDPDTSSFFALDEIVDTGETHAYFQKRLDRALDAFDRSSKCRY